MEIGPDNHYGQQSSLVNELSQGMELAKQLKANIGSESSAELLQQILSSYDKALFILGSGPGEQPTQLEPHVVSPVMGSPSTISPEKTDKFSMGSDSQHHQVVPNILKKSSSKKKATIRNEQVRLNPNEGMEGPPNDGFNWRKYGQKDILGARYPRSYYRCTYRHMQGCWAKRHVQRSDEDPAVFNISYKGKHTCELSPHRSKSAPTSPPAQHQHQPETQLSVLNSYDPNLLMRFQTGLNVNTQDTDSNSNIVAFPFAVDGMNATTTPKLDSSSDFYYPTSLISPSTPGPSYFPCQMDTFEGLQYQYHNSEQDIINNSIISAAASATNSPTIQPDLPFEWSFDPSFMYTDPRSFH